MAEGGSSPSLAGGESSPSLAGGGSCSFIDTHSHLYDPAFGPDADEVLQRAFAAGATKIFLPNINSTTIQPMLQLANRYPGRLYPMLGLHPEDLGDTWQTVLPQMEQLLANPNHPFIAVGEVGLDYYWDRTLYDEQQLAFAQQARWALRYQLPLMIHSRSAHRELVDVLLSIDPTKQQLSGVFHCFGGTASEAQELLTFPHFMLGIGGVVTFKKSKLPEVLRQNVPLERIVLETDSPYLAPTPHRGKRNETAFLTEVIHKLAEIYSCSDDQIATITTENALKTFPKAR
ncbi:MAG: TatD family hydrolase [Bacteroidaceae bacterium]|nr:TatD family hydrolase [Bacteroidaceae bacterium]